jgi:hypothetical protein
VERPVRLRRSEHLRAAAWGRVPFGAGPRLTYKITEDGGPGVCRLTVVHEVGGAPSVAAMVEGAPGAEQQQGGGGWPWVLSDLKTLLERGSSFTAP